MGYVSEYVSGACDLCLRAKQNKRGDWYCTKNEDDFPDATFDGPDEYEPTSCPSFKPDKNCYNEEDWIWD
ncbi:MAG: hypothetical protein J1E63_07365 [Muribaculaceae bacterium]|nr:hypothetical protein [Muribaculaceae bacterium]